MFSKKTAENLQAIYIKKKNKSCSGRCAKLDQRVRTLAATSNYLALFLGTHMVEKKGFRNCSLSLLLCSDTNTHGRKKKQNQPT